jgi:exosome complex component RRP42
MGDYSTETISHIDRDFISDLLRKGERLDGRGFAEYRDLEIEANIVAAKAEGSALVRLGDTSVVAGVKVLVGEPYSDSPDQGVTMVTAEMSPIASPLFELGPPKMPAIELARVVDRGVRESETIDAKKLCIEEGKKVYMVFADVYPLEYDGNLIDASSIAVNTALENLIIDPILKEEFVQDCRLTMAVDRENKFTAMQKGGGAGPMSIELVEKAMEIALENAEPIRKAIEEATKAVE